MCTAFIHDLDTIKLISHKIDMFCDYLYKSYIDDRAICPPTLWTCHTASLKQSTNPCESFRSRFYDSFNIQHPNMFTFTA